jgi:hypothetical protein
MYDDGRNGGDQNADDGIYSYKLTREAPVGEFTFMITVRDSKGAEAYANVTLKVDPLSEFTEKPEIIDAGADPPRVPNDGFTMTTIWAIVQDAENDIYEVTADLTPLGGDKNQELNDDGVDGDLFSNDDNYSFAITVGPLIPLDIYQIEITALDETDHETIERIWVDVILPPVPPVITSIIVDPDTIVNDGEQKAEVIATVEDDNDDVTEVWVDLSPLRGSSKALMEFIGGDTWSLEFTAGSSVTPGLKGRIEVTAEDRTGMTASDDFSITIEKANTPPEILDINLSKYTFNSDDEVTIAVSVADADFDTMQVSVDLSSLLIFDDLVLLDDGQGADETEGDSIYSGTFTITVLVISGNYTITVMVNDSKGAQTTQDVTVAVETGDIEDVVEALGTILYIGLPVIGGFVLGILVLIAVVRSRAAPKPNAPIRGPPGRSPPMGPPGRGMPAPMGPRPMR